MVTTQTSEMGFKVEDLLDSQQTIDDAIDSLAGKKRMWDNEKQEYVYINYGNSLINEKTAQNLKGFIHAYISRNAVFTDLKEDRILTHCKMFGLNLLANIFDENDKYDIKPENIGIVVFTILANIEFSLMKSRNGRMLKLVENIFESKTTNISKVEAPENKRKFLGLVK